jgi:hypothetical protein
VRESTIKKLVNILARENKHSSNGELLDHSMIPVALMINEITFLCVLLVDDLIFIRGAVSNRVTLLLRVTEA